MLIYYMLFTVGMRVMERVIRSLFVVIIFMLPHDLSSMEFMGHMHLMGRNWLNGHWSCSMMQMVVAMFNIFMCNWIMDFVNWACICAWIIRMMVLKAWRMSHEVHRIM